MHHPDHSHGGNGGAGSEPAAGHGMAVIGAATIFMSHLPMFMSPHDYQVILRGELSSPEADPEAAYREDRKAHQDAKLYTFAPRKFVLPDLFPGENDEPPRSTSFVGSLVRNHFEEPPAHPEPAAEIAPNTTVNVLEIVHAHKFEPDAGRLEQLEYLLFGRGSERFMAHLVTGPPDFDQLLAVELKGQDFSDQELRHGVRLSLPGRENTPAQRVREGEKDVACTARVDGQDAAPRLDATVELYFETADLERAM